MMPVLPAHASLCTRSFSNLTSESKPLKDWRTLDSQQLIFPEDTAQRYPTDSPFGIRSVGECGQQGDGCFAEHLWTTFRHYTNATVGTSQLSGSLQDYGRKHAVVVRTHCTRKTGRPPHSFMRRTQLSRRWHLAVRGQAFRGAGSCANGQAVRAAIPQT
jgi:hypothetical protein